ncbi:MAG: MoaD/ThiS family protein [Nitrososphaerales archaeon]
MVKVKLLGQLKTLFGKDFFIFDEEIKMDEIIKRLNSYKKLNLDIERRDFIIIVNGVESSLVDEDKLLKKDDEVILVPIIHGGL